MFWKVNYVVDTGYEWKHCVCIIKAESEEAALEILHTDFESNLPGEKFILDNYTEITECNNGAIIYNSWR